MAIMGVIPEINSVSRGRGLRSARGLSDGAIIQVPWFTALALEGRVFYASDADQNDLVTGQTSFAATTPSFLLRVPSGTTAIPLMVDLGQTGSVAGGAVDVIIEIDDADRYSSGGTAETILSARTDQPITPACSLYSGATASAGYGVRVIGRTIGQDVSPAEGAVNAFVWHPSLEAPPLLVGPAALAIYTYAGTTGPTWFWTIKWAELPTASAVTFAT